MKTRRDFIKNMSVGAALSTVVISPAGAMASNILSGSTEKNVRVGIIGAENSHTSHFGSIFNLEKQFSGVELTHVWGETKELAHMAAAKSNIPNIVEDPNNMLGNIDALIVDHRHAKYHLEPAIPFIKEGIPTFIDKPFCYRLKEGRKFLELAEKHGTSVTSFSTIAQSEATFDISRQLKGMDDIKEVVRFGPADLDSKHGGIFFYGVHLVQPLMYMFGDDVEKVKVTRNKNKGSASLVFKSGLFATLVFNSISYGWSTYIDTKDGVIELKSEVKEPTPKRADSDIVKMFRTGEQPRSYESILKCVAVLEALEKSSYNEEWVKVETI